MMIDVSNFKKKFIMKIILVLLLMPFFISSCSEDFLNLVPQHNSNEGTYFQTETHFTQALNGAYQKLRSTTDIQGYLIGEMRSDNTHYTFYATDRPDHIVFREDIANFVNNDRNQWTNNMYYECYNGISRANAVLGRIEAKGFSEAFTNEIVGQAKFLRAYFYFQLVRCFGGVPLYLQEVKDTDNAFLPRASEDETYNAILADVNDAIGKLKVVSFPQNGAVTQGAARMLLAKVLMTKPQRDYAGAEAQLREIMKMGYELQPDYADVFDISLKNSKESIFEVQYQQGDQGQQSNWLYYFIPKTTNAEKITGVPNCSTVLTGGWNVPTQEMVDSYEPGDLRLNTSVAVAVGYDDEISKLFVPEKVLNVGDPEIEEYKVAYFFVNKYRHAHSKILNTDDNWPIYRYSDVLLSLAECLVEQNRSSESIPYVNQVRSRAGLKGVPAVDADVVANERRHEFAFENHRWFDLVRTGKAIQVMTEYGKRTKAMYPYLLDGTYNVTKDKLILPLPYRELQMNTKLVQNPGYN